MLVEWMPEEVAVGVVGRKRKAEGRLVYMSVMWCSAAAWLGVGAGRGHTPPLFGHESVASGARNGRAGGRAVLCSTWLLDWVLVLAGDTQPLHLVTMWRWAAHQRASWPVRDLLRSHLAMNWRWMA